MYAVTTANYTAEGTTSSSTRTSTCQNEAAWPPFSPTTGLMFAQNYRPPFNLVWVRKVTTSPYHPQTNGGTERMHHTMPQLLAVAVNERRYD